MDDNINVWDLYDEAKELYYEFDIKKEQDVVFIDHTIDFKKLINNSDNIKEFIRILFKNHPKYNFYETFVELLMIQDKDIPDTFEGTIGI